MQDFSQKVQARMNSRRFALIELVIGVVFVALSVCIFKDPTFTMALLVVLVGLAAILRGGARLLFFLKYREEYGLNAWITLIFGVLNIAVGVLLLLNIAIGILTLGMLFACWFFIDAAANLVNFQFIAPMGRAYSILNVVYNVIGVLLGVYLIFNPLAAAEVVAFAVALYFLLHGISGIVIAFNAFASRDSVFPEKETIVFPPPPEDAEEDDSQDGHDSL